MLIYEIYLIDFKMTHQEQMTVQKILYNFNGPMLDMMQKCIDPALNFGDRTGYFGPRENCVQDIFHREYKKAMENVQSTEASAAYDVRIRAIRMDFANDQVKNQQFCLRHHKPK